MAKIIYVMGPSGSGKDTIINTLRSRSMDNLQVAHRYITRDWQSAGENHIELSQQEFEQRKTLGFFALDWAANQQQYAIGKEIDIWLSNGQNVLVNGSRSYLAEAMALYPDMIKPVLIEVAMDKLQQRLFERGRENPVEIDLRLQRHRQLSKTADAQHSVIENNHSIEAAVDQLATIVKECI